MKIQLIPPLILILSLAILTHSPILALLKNGENRTIARIIIIVFALVIIVPQLWLYNYIHKVTPHKYQAAFDNPQAILGFPIYHPTYFPGISTEGSKFVVQVLAEYRINYSIKIGNNTRSLSFSETKAKNSLNDRQRDIDIGLFKNANFQINNNPALITYGFDGLNCCSLIWEQNGTRIELGYYDANEKNLALLEQEAIKIAESLKPI